MWRVVSGYRKLMHISPPPPVRDAGGEEKEGGKPNGMPGARGGMTNE